MRVIGARKGFPYNTVKLVLTVLANGNMYDFDSYTFSIPIRKLKRRWIQLVPGLDTN